MSCTLYIKTHSHLLPDHTIKILKTLYLQNCTARANGQDGAICTCFSIECASLNRNRPIRLCATCHSLKHSTENGSKHVFNVKMPDVWACNAEIQVYLVEAIIR